MRNRILTSGTDRIACPHGKQKYSCVQCRPDAVYKAYTRGALKRNLTFDLSFDEFCLLVNGVCRYCDTCPANGVDRINSEKGYSEVNSQSCCKTCNLMKLDLHEHEFLSHILLIAEAAGKRKAASIFAPESGGVPGDVGS